MNEDRAFDSRKVHIEKLATLVREIDGTLDKMRSLLAELSATVDRAGKEASNAKLGHELSLP